jgi:hypothetical protein
MTTALEVQMRNNAILLLILGGCGPLTQPMVERLPPEEQKHVDDAWQNMFSPPDRLDRTLLLDVLITQQAHQRGVDRLDLVSEKCVGKGRAVMTVRFDRQHPEFDEFTIAYLDDQGRELRRERYSSAEIQERIHLLFRPSIPESQPVDWQRYEEQEKLRQARMNEIEAATQPGP